MDSLPILGVLGSSPGQDGVKRIEFSTRSVSGVFTRQGAKLPPIIMPYSASSLPSDVPTAPGKPEIVDYDNKSVDLKWTVPESDGGAPIQKYIVQKKDR